MDQLNRVLSRLERVRKAGGVFWALCPAHDDHHPSLNITETNEGKILLKCWTGCTAQEVVDSIGLELRDLFPETESGWNKPRETIDREVLEHAQYVVQIGENWKQQGKNLTGKDRRDYLTAKAIVDIHGRGDDSWMNALETVKPEPPVDMSMADDPDFWDRKSKEVKQKHQQMITDAVLRGEVDPHK